MKKMKQVLSGVMSLLMTLSLFANIPAYALANEDIGMPEPEALISVEPTAETMPEPTAEPVAEPTVEPATEATVEPTAEPMPEPTAEPTAEPTVEPTAEPTSEPVGELIVEPVEEPAEQLAERSVVVVLSDATQEQLFTANAFWQWLAGRALKPVGYQWPGDLAVEITGLLPEGVVASLSFLTYNEWEAYDENALFDVSISLHDRNGNPYTPSSALKVTLKGSLVNNALIADQSLFVYARTEN